mgnify:CR=1 FL=1
MSATIKLRSPYYIKTTPTTNTYYVAIGLKMWQGAELSPPSTYTYNLTKFVVDDQDFVIFEVSALARDYLKITNNGQYNQDTALFLRYDYTCFDSNGATRHWRRPEYLDFRRAPMCCSILDNPSILSDILPCWCHD